MGGGEKGYIDTIGLWEGKAWWRNIQIEKSLGIWNKQAKPVMANEVLGMNRSLLHGPYRVSDTSHRPRQHSSPATY